MYLVRREVTDRNLKAKDGFRFGDFAVLRTERAALPK